jgi:hypothetical protein
MRFKQLFIGSVLFAFITLSIIPVMLHADFYIQQKRHTDAFEVMGKTEPAKDEMSVMWMSGDRGRIDTGEDHSMIIRLDKNIMYGLDHTRMQYTEMPFGSLDDIVSHSLAQSGMSGEEQAEAQKVMKGFMGMMKIEAEVTETDEKKNIKGWNCRKYIMKTKMMGMGGTSEIWATEEIKINYDLYRSLGAAFLAKQPGAEKLFEEMKKIKGIPIMTVSTSSAMGTEVKSTEELIEAKEKSAPAGLYDIPEGYKKVK